MSINCKRYFLATLVMFSCGGVRADDTPPMDDLTAKATQGDARAQLSLALRYRDGKGVERDDSQAMRWAHLAADAGDADAMDFVGFAFLRGRGVHGDPAVAFGYFNAAAGRCAMAGFNLGQCYFGAQGVGLDIPKAVEVWS